MEKEWISSIADQTLRAGHHVIPNRYRSHEITASLKSIIQKSLQNSVGHFTDSPSASSSPSNNSSRSDDTRIVYQELAERIFRQLLLLVQRLSNDAAAIQRALGVSCERVVSLDGPFSDIHTGGALVVRIQLDKQALFYKPRSIEGNNLLRSLIKLIDPVVYRSSRMVPRSLSRDEYGWSVEAEKRDPAGMVELKELAWRCGFLSRVLMCIRSGDHHNQNLLINGSQICCLDLECSLLPRLVFEQCPKKRFTLRATGLIGQALNCAGSADPVSPLHSWGRTVRKVLEFPDPYQFQSSRADPMAIFRKEFRDGFRYTGRLFSQNYQDCRDLIRTFSTACMRVVVRPTRYYRELIRHVFDPRVCGTLERRQALVISLLPAPNRALLPLAEAEAAAVLRCEIPIFVYRPGSKILLGARGAIFGVVRENGIDAALRDMPCPKDN